MMIVLGVFPTDNFNGLSALLVSAIAILLVFLILIIIIFFSYLASKGVKKLDGMSSIMPREENKILETDEDAVIAALIATIEYNNETHKDARLISIEKIDE